ncbi:SusC/RagA family TonB-linked outer membrane protein [Bacteroidia bacterium]|nr:SusC/RagA family TonB-linked outer membrane protein [Bacteroidia bacterium]GHV04491.1 SusC/RagA family TonB-linked outer membrane protein [Bacteroidia bacterium]
MVFILATLSLPVFAQTKIEGSILDDHTRESLPGVAVSIDGGKTGTISDANGHFTLQASSFPLTLSISFIGYKTQELDVYEYTAPITILLHENSEWLQEVVVVGYGNQKRRELTSAISSVSKDILVQVSPSFENLLSGSVAGLNVSQSSGQPGATSTIRIRGGNSITGGNEPLYVIDGFLVYNDPTATQTGAGRNDATLNPLASINSSDIESIEVLKDVSATAIYGTRGANGVIIITTKQGKRGSNTVNYQSTVGWQTIRKKIDFLSGTEWGELYNEIRTDEGRLGDLIPADQVTAFGKGYDWQDTALHDGIIQTHQLSFIGGDDNTRYAISGNYTDQQGIIVGTGLNRYSARVNLDRDISKKVRVGVNISGTYTTLNGLVGGGGNETPNAWVAALRTPPVIPIYTADGSFNYSNPYASAQRDGVSPNPISDLENEKAITNNLRLLGLFYLEYKIISGLTFKVNAGVDLGDTKQSNYAPSYVSNGFNNQGTASIGNKKVNTWQAEYTLNYNKIFNEIHSVDALVGYTAQRTDRNAFSANSYGFSNDATFYNSLQSASNSYLPSSSSFTSTLISYLGRVNYSFNAKYNVTATLRADGSSRFAPNHHWGYFPSLGLSWNIDNEPFFKSSWKVSHLQFRLSGGTVGNQEIGDFRFISNVVPRTYYFSNTPVTAFVPGNLSNPNLKWETTHSYNFGVNLGLFNDRLNAVFDAYYKVTNDLLLDVPIELVSGFRSVTRNEGRVSNKGVELELDGKIIEKKNLNWRASVNFAKNINRIESLGNAEYFIPSFEGVSTLTYLSPLIVQKGQPLGSFLGYEFDGIIQKGDDLTNIPKPTFGQVKPGEAKYVNQNPDEDNVINEADRKILGNSQPKFTGGFNTSLAYKRFDLFLSLQGSYGNKLFNVFACRLEKTNTYYNSLATVADRWTETNPSNRIAKATNSTSIVVDDRYIEDASYLKLRNISIGYTFPLKQITKNTKIRIFASAQNLLTWTPYSGYDPESNRNGKDEFSGLYQGVDFGTYPSSRTIQFGINISL